jgi:hypothetical protein
MQVVPKVQLAEQDPLLPGLVLKVHCGVTAVPASPINAVNVSVAEADIGSENLSKVSTKPIVVTGTPFCVAASETKRPLGLKSLVRPGLISVNLTSSQQVKLVEVEINLSSEL